MQQGKSVYQGKTKNGLDIIIRYPNSTDLEQLTDYINTLSKEKTFIRFQGEQQTTDQEKAWLDVVLRRIDLGMDVSLYAEIEGQLIGVSDVSMRDRIESHVGLFGLTIAKEFRQEGIGTLLMQTTIEEAIKKLPQMKIITLSVFANNPAAIGLYKKFGFKEYGNLPAGIFHRAEYVDHIYMFKNVD